MGQENRLEKCANFIGAVEKFIEEIDSLIIENKFEAIKIESVAKDFFNKHRNFIESFPFKYSHFRFPRCSHSEIIEEDNRILMNVEEEEKNEVAEQMKKGEDKKKQQQNEKLLDDEILRAGRKSMASFYSRACAACYFRVTLFKSRYNEEQDRREPLDLARYAIRYDSTNYHANLSFMIVQGWHCDNVTKPKERIMLGRCFRQAALNTIRMNPNESLSYNLLGRFYFHVASLSWLERKVTNNLLGGKIEGSYEDAEREFLRSHERKKWMPNGLWMARVLLAQKRPMEEVKKWIDFGLSMEVEEPTSEIERRELLELRSKLKLCSNQS